MQKISTPAASTASSPASGWVTDFLGTWSEVLTHFATRVGDQQREMFHWWASWSQDMSRPQVALGRALRLNQDFVRSMAETVSDAGRLAALHEQSLSEKWRRGLELAGANSMNEFQSSVAELASTGQRLLRARASVATRMGGRWMEPWTQFWRLPGAQSDADDQPESSL